MVDIYEPAKRVLYESIESGEEFSIQEIEKEIDAQGGIYKVAPGISLKKHLRRLNQIGDIKKGSSRNTYIKFDRSLETSLV